MHNCSGGVGADCVLSSCSAASMICQMSSTVCVPRVHLSTFASCALSVAGPTVSVPRVRLSTFASRALSVTGPTIWNSLPDELHDPAVDSRHS